MFILPWGSFIKQRSFSITTKWSFSQTKGICQLWKYLLLVPTTIKGLKWKQFQEKVKIMFFFSSIIFQQSNFPWYINLSFWIKNLEFCFGHMHDEQKYELYISGRNQGASDAFLKKQVVKCFIRSPDCFIAVNFASPKCGRAPSRKNFSPIIRLFKIGKSKNWGNLSKIPIKSDFVTNFPDFPIFRF